jgi:hypothetical protein
VHCSGDFIIGICGKFLGKIQQIFVFGFHLNAFYFNKKNPAAKIKHIIEMFQFIK